ncbi:multiple coagulation factor deficiency protein 2 homolog [Glandiceps talaboti]
MDSLKLCSICLVLVCCLFSLASCQNDVHTMDEGSVPHARSKTLKDKGKVQQQQQHIKSHLEDEIGKPENEMTDQELQFHYFKLHDYDNNNLLDGIELASAMTHYHEEDEGHEGVPMDEDEIAEMIDQILLEDDTDKNGYIDFPEFVFSTQ